MTTTADTPNRHNESATAAGVQPGHSAVRTILMRVHFYAGLFVGPFLLVAAVTGLLYSLIPQLDTYVYRDYLTVERVGVERLPLSDQINAATTATDGSVTSIRPPGDHPSAVCRSWRTSGVLRNRVRRSLHGRGSRFVDHLGPMDAAPSVVRRVAPQPASRRIRPPLQRAGGELVVGHFPCRTLLVDLAPPQIQRTSTDRHTRQTHERPSAHPLVARCSWSVGCKQFSNCAFPP